MVRQTDISRGYVDWSSVPFSDLSWKEAPKYTLADGDILVSRLGNGVGNAATVRDAGYAVFAGYLVRFRVNRSRAVPEFVGYQLQSPTWRQYVKGFRSGAAQPTLNAVQMANFTFRLPSLDEQRAVAAVLGALDDKIAANTRLAAIADDLAAATVRRALDTSASIRLDELAIIKMGSSPTGATLNESGDGLVFYQGVRDFGTRFPSRRVWTTAPTRTADEGDVLVSVRAPVGEVNLANERLCIGRGLAAVRSRSAHQSTLFHLLKHVPEAWAPYEAEGTVFGSINRAQLHSLELPRLADGIDPEALELEVRALESRIASALRESSTLTALRDTLLPQLMSGKLRVREAAEMAGL